MAATATSARPGEAGPSRIWSPLTSGGAGGSAPVPGPKHKGGGPKQPDPMQTSVGYIGGDAFHRKNRGGRGGRGGGGGQGGGFGGRHGR